MTLFGSSSFFNLPMLPKVGSTWAHAIYRAKGPGRAQIQLAKVRNRVRQSDRTWFYDVLKTVCLTCAFMRFTQDSLKTWEFLDPLFCSFHTSYSVYSSTDRHPCAISEHFAPSDVHLKSRRPRQISRFNPRLCHASPARQIAAARLGAGDQGSWRLRSLGSAAAQLAQAVSLHVSNDEALASIRRSITFGSSTQVQWVGDNFSW